MGFGCFDESDIWVLMGTVFWGPGDGGTVRVKYEQIAWSDEEFTVRNGMEVGLKRW